MKTLHTCTAAFILTACRLFAAEPLQEMIDNASSGDTITIPAGTYTEPLQIRTPIILDGNDAVLEIESNQPAIEISTRQSVTLKNLNIRYQTTTKQQNNKYPFVILTSKGKLLIENCTVKETGRSGETTSAVFASCSTLHIENSRFDGFDYTIEFWDESKGCVEDCLIMNSGHCGITLGNNSSAKLIRNIVTGSSFHGIRCTGGEIIADSNLIIANQNRGFYIGNKSASGTLSNNLIIDNETGINVYANSKLDLINNVILRSTYAGLAIADTTNLDIENNIIADNERGIVGFSSQKGEEASIRLRDENIAYNNATQTEGIKLPSELIGIDPQFTDSDTGLFATGKHIKEMGLTNPEAMQALWKKWKDATNR